jgi:hypothetical protein
VDLKTLINVMNLDRLTEVALKPPLVRTLMEVAHKLLLAHNQAQTLTEVDLKLPLGHNQA